MERDTSTASSPSIYQLAPEQIAGPYFRNPKLLRRNISEGARVNALLADTNGRLTYKDLIA